MPVMITLMISIGYESLDLLLSIKSKLSECAIYFVYISMMYMLSGYFITDNYLYYTVMK